MTRSTRISACLGLAMALAALDGALADPWRDESDQGRGGREGRSPVLVVPVPEPPSHYGPPPGYAHGPPPGRYAEPRISQGHLPPPGECRLWLPDRAAGQQPPPGRC